MAPRQQTLIDKGKQRATPESDEDDVHARDFAAQPAATLDLNAEADAAFNFAGPVENDEESEEEMQWEAVEEQPTDGPPLKKVDEAIEVIIERAPGVKLLKEKAASNRRPPPTPAERAARQDLHKVHILSLLASGRDRNRLLNDDLLQARLMSKCPLPLQDAFYAFSRQTHPNERDRARLFDNAMKRLVSWWYNEFEVDPFILGVRTRSYGEVERELRREGVKDMDDLLALWAKADEDKARDPFGPSETIRNAQSLMKRAVQLKGSSQCSAQLFTALCRAIGIPARLVFSLQPVDWHATAAATEPKPTSKKRKREPASAKSKGKGKAKVSTEEEASTEGDFEEIVPPGQGSSSRPISIMSDGDSKPISIASHTSTEDDEDEPAVWGSRHGGPPIKLRPSKPPKRDIRSITPDATAMAVQPIYWTEVYSRAGKEWVPIDVTRKKVRCRSIMEPPKANPHNKMLYVVAYEEDGYLRDVTPRYVKQFGAVTAKNRVPSKKGEDWWANAIRPLKRPFTLDRDAKEDAELVKSQVNETMPQHVGGFKDHPLYALERHLKREEFIHPRKKLGIFRTEEVFPRSSVITVKSAENYMKEGRRIKAGEQPMKLVKQRAVTINKVRAQEAAVAEGEEPIQQGLYAKWQTELVKPQPVKDGKVPRNGFGNLDVFAPHMVPAGGKHLPYKGIAKVAKQLGVDFAEAITGFEFHKRRAVPVASGIIVPIEEAEAVLEAFWASEHHAVEKEMAKKEERVLKRWKLLIKGLRLRERLQAEYRPVGESSGASTPLAGTNGRNELLDLDTNESEEITSDAAPLTHAAPSAPANLSNTLSSLAKGHAGAKKTKRLPTGSGAGAIELSSDDEDVEEVKVARPKKRRPPPVDGSEVEAVEEPPRKARRRPSSDDEEEDDDDDASFDDEAMSKRTSRSNGRHASTSARRPRRAAANKAVSYNERGPDVSSSEEEE